MKKIKGNLTLKQFEKALKMVERIERVDLISELLEDMIQEMADERSKKIISEYKDRGFKIG
jgi:predicted DNA-binding protein YlxM (UPF0122 family)